MAGAGNVAGLLRDAYSAFEESRLLVEAEFESYTLLWPGGGVSYTERLHSGRERSQPASVLYDREGGVAVPQYPSAAQLLGRARWLLRSIAAGLRPEARGGVVGHDSVDGVASLLFGYLPESRPGREYPRARASRYSVHVEFEPRVIGLNEHRRYLTVTPCAGRYLSKYCGRKGGVEKLLDQAMGLLRRALEGEDFEPDEVERAILLFAIPRFYLHHMGVAPGWYTFYTQPLAPGIRMRLRVMLSPHADPDPLLDETAALALLLTPQLLGLGKATSRGFGRFKLLGARPEEAYQKCIPSLSNTSCLREALGRLEELVGKILVEKLNKSVGVVGARRLVPPLSASSVYTYSRLYHPYPYPIAKLHYVAMRGGRGASPRTGGYQCFAKSLDCDAIRNPYVKAVCQLSAIGYATLKATWKTYSVLKGKIRSSGIKFSGAAYHTWPLGLPRSVKKGKIITGYLIAKIGNDRCSGNLKNVKIKGKYRLQSQLHIYPNPSEGFTILRFASDELLGDLAYNEKGKALYHVGTHRNRKTVAHVLSVAKIASYPPPSRISVNKVLVTTNIVKPGCPVYLAECDSIKGSSPGDASVVAGKVLDAAVEWIVYLLSGSC